MRAKEKPIEKNDIKAFLGPGSTFEGKLSFNEVVRMDGVFKGEVVSDGTLIAGESADIQGELKVGSFVLSGKFKGNIKAAKRVELRKPAILEGTIDAPALSIEEGVTFNGTMRMGKDTGSAPVSERLEAEPKKL